MDIGFSVPEDSLFDAGVVTSLAGQVDRLRHCAVLGQVVLVGSGSAAAAPDLPSWIRYETADRADWDDLLAPDVDVVLVHSAAAGAPDEAVMEAVVSAVRAGSLVAVPVSAMTDTIKLRTAAGFLRSTVDRSVLRRLHVPWGCARSRLHGPVRIPDGGVAAMPWSLHGPVVPVQTDPSPVATVRS